jgi:RNA polymerase sigma-54 factor
MKPALQLRLSQQLALTPQLQQSIKLLQLSTLELETEIERYLLENPLLEREDDDGDTYGSTATPGNGKDTDDGHETASGEDSLPTEDRTTDFDGFDSEWAGEGGSYPSASRAEEDEDNDYQDIQAATTNLRDHLCWQLGVTVLSDDDASHVRLLIEALDDDGYLTQSIEELAESYETSVEDLQIALAHLQNFDPTGVGARDARECLLLQLEVLPEDSVSALATTVVSDHLDLLAAHNFQQLRKLTNCDDETLREAMALIQSLDPRPGAQYTPIETRYVVPDVIVRKTRGRWEAAINPDAFPRLRVNRLYAQILSQQRGSGLSGQLQEARWLIKNVQQRFETILRVTQAIVDRQRQFFDHGEVAMRPLVLREIAEILELHESTISRVTTQKYMATPRGIFELKYFFGSHVATEAGGACSSTAIRALIKQLVAAENPKRPLSDNQISELLGQQGIVVARRTIAKYRDALAISPANLRKSL